VLSEHKHCDNPATNSNSENARSRVVASLQGSVGMGTKEDELSTGRIWAAGFHHVMAHSHLVHVLKLRTVYFFNFPNTYRSAVCCR
jgi:methionine salvage enolase-phosphatase E1